MSTDAEFIAKLRTLNIGKQSRRGPKTVTDVHDHHTVDVTEHWDDRVSVNVKLETLHVPVETAGQPLRRTVARDSPRSTKERDG